MVKIADTTTPLTVDDLYTPETVDELIAIKYWCDSCDCWHQHYLGYAVEVAGENAKYGVEITDVRCDCDGNWEFDSSGVEPTKEALVNEYEILNTNAAKAEIEYAEWVAKHGEDPLREFFAGVYVRRVRERWEVKFAASDGSFPKLHSIRRAHKKWWRMSVQDFPGRKELFAYLTVNRRTLEARLSWKQLLRCGMSNSGVFVAEYDRVVDRSAASIERDVRRAARAFLRQKRREKDAGTIYGKGQ
jgi:hypothetical protein